MNPNDPPQTSEPELKVNNPMAAMRPGERNLFEVKRHPIGLAGVYVSMVLLLLIVAVVAFVVAPSVITSYSKSFVTEIGAVVFLLAAVLAAIFMLIARTVYQGNRWILTSDSLTQVLQRSLFDKQSSQLSLGNLEDVTVQQDGILCHMFNYGVLRVETAGERSKFVFAYCPNPNDYAQKILGAREDFEQGRRDGDMSPYRPENTYQNAPQNQAPTTAYTVPTGNDDDTPGVNIDTE